MAQAEEPCFGLMINGRNDYFCTPLESQLPMFRMLGTPAEHKRHLVRDGGHVPTRISEVFRQAVEWLDRIRSGSGQIYVKVLPDGEPRQLTRGGLTRRAPRQDTRRALKSYAGVRSLAVERP